MEERSVRNPVIKEPFDIRMEIRQYEPRITKLEMEIRQYEPRIKALERGVERLEQSCYAIVERLKALENRQNAAMYNNDSETDIE